MPHGPKSVGSGGSGFFLVVDGPSGSGKDSLVAALTSKLRSLGVLTFPVSEEELDTKRHEVLEARERGKALGGTGDREMAEVLVMHRAGLYRKFVGPHLRSGHLVLANRGEPATLAYQTARGELTMDEIWDMHRTKGVPIPGMVVLTRCSAQTAIKREEGDRALSPTREKREGGRGLSGKVTQEAGADKSEQLRRRRLIHAQFNRAAQFLRSKGVRIRCLNTERLAVSQEVGMVLRAIGL